jgi:hypothetical protein
MRNDIEARSTVTKRPEAEASMKQKTFDFNLISEESKKYLKSEMTENGEKRHWIKEPFFTFSDFEKEIEKQYNSRLKFVLEDNITPERLIQFIKDEIKDIEKLNISLPQRDYNKLCFAEKTTYWFSDETLEEFERYYKEYRGYKFIEFKKEFLNKKFAEIKNPKPEPLDLSDTSTVKRNKPNKLKKGLDEFFYNIIDKEKFLKELKATFTTERGKNLKIIISLLIEANVLIINSREFKDFHSELVTFFDRNIGTRQSINDVIFNNIPKPTIEPIEKKLNPLIIKYKTK